MWDFFSRKARNRIFINPGTPVLADTYYKRIGQLLQATFVDEAGVSLPNSAKTLDDLLVFLGYRDATKTKGLKATDLERLDSFLLMPRNSGEFTALDNSTAGELAQHLSLADFFDASRPKVLVTRFFAPKIVTYYDGVDAFQPVKRDSLIPGWRKLARVPARSGSGAASAGIEHAYILFNVKEPNPDANPFLKESQNNQVILVPRTFDPVSRNDACFFAVYKGRADGYALTDSLGADFDLPGHAAVQGGAGSLDSHYYVPTSCAACHGHYAKGNPVGGKFPFAKPNYLDTDQWYDWMEFDFRGVTTSLNDVVFDGGKDHGSAQYKRAFEVIAALNATVRDESFRAERVPGAKSFQTLGPEKWLALHVPTGGALDPARKPYAVRSISANAADHWDPSSPDEMKLLRLLDNHCFRCHSSLAYHVFDKSAVRDNAFLIDQYLTQEVRKPDGTLLPGFFMPQGRVLEAAERDEIKSLVNKLFIPTKVKLASKHVDLTLVGSNYKFTLGMDDNPTITVAAGSTVKVSLTSAGGLHDWVLADLSGNEITRTARVSGNTPVSKEFTVPAAGNYIYFCSVGSHQEEGMEGRFAVEAP